MIKASFFALLIAASFGTVAVAEPSNEDPAPTPYPFVRSSLTGEAVTIRGYGCRPFPIRVYATPQEGPLYNVPPYAVISPY